MNESPESSDPEQDEPSLVPHEAGGQEEDGQAGPEQEETEEEAALDDDGEQNEVSEAVAALLGDKLYFKIGEVARIVGVKPYVLRYWETEFSILKPGKTRSKHRLYRRRDVELLLRIKDLLHTRRFTIEGARKKLREESSGAEAAAPSTGALAEIREALVRIRDSLA